MEVLKIQLRRGTALDWSIKNPVLLAGEIGYELDDNKFKIGDGVHNYNDLEYFIPAAAFQQQIEDAIADAVLNGVEGEQGPAGPAGPAGPQGPAGPAGADGATGPQGPAGATGATGPQGPAGADGATGPQGLKGDTGNTGPAGPAGADGPQGLAGADGAQGPQGIQGPAGATGSQGIQGPAGATGPQGPAGATGATGAQGASGVSFITYSISGALTAAAGSHIWVNNTGRTLTILSVRATAGTPPTGANIIIDVNRNGTTIFTTQANRPTIVAGNSLGVKVTNMDVTTIADGQFIKIDVDQIGSTVAGSDLVVQIEVA